MNARAEDLTPIVDGEIEERAGVHYKIRVELHGRSCVIAARPCKSMRPWVEKLGPLRIGERVRVRITDEGRGRGEIERKVM